MQPLIKRVEEVLCDGAGVARTIAAANRFRRGPRPLQTRSEQGTEAMVQKGCYVAIVSAEPMDQPEMHNVLSYIVRVRIDLFYNLPDGQMHTRFRDAVVEAATDMHRIRMALGYPSNLQATAAGAATGLSGSALQFERWTMQDPDPTHKLLRASATAIGRINMTA